ncbi:STAS domain-containing protein [Mycobacterium sp. pW049]|uniref:STAS domain-containing protein n=1 Tax=[Mycobacterium] bulgaricum TaxID=3238985 RepID=UPI00351AD740
MQQFTEHQLDGVVIVSAVGAVDMLTAPKLQEAIDAVVERKPAGLIVDLTDVDFLGSAGMQVLVLTQKRVDGQSRFAVVADGPATSRPLKVTGLTDYVDLFSTLDAAVADLRDD